MYSRPSIDVLFETAADAFGAATAAVVLSGANSDGARGAARIAQRGRPRGGAKPRQRDGRRPCRSPRSPPAPARSSPSPEHIAESFVEGARGHDPGARPLPARRRSRRPICSRMEALLRRDDLVLLKARSGVEALELLLKPRHRAGVDRRANARRWTASNSRRSCAATERTKRTFRSSSSPPAAHDIQRRFRGYEAGAVDFLGKPIEPDMLRSKANVFFELDRQRQQIAQQNAGAEVLRAARFRKPTRARTSFSPFSGHELRNPLAPLANGLSLPSPRIPDADKGRARCAR